MDRDKRRICALVVDDTHDVAESFAKMLATMGCEATFITDARSGVEEALRIRPHIAFLDLGMPYVNGYQLARELRKHFPPESLKLVAVTAYGAPEDRAASRKAGFDAHVQKPVDPNIIDCIIKTVLPDL
jgi:CheY-like chemotaxis protein